MDGSRTTEHRSSSQTPSSPNNKTPTSRTPPVLSSCTVSQTRFYFSPMDISDCRDKLETLSRGQDFQELARELALHFDQHVCAHCLAVDGLQEASDVEETDLWKSSTTSTAAPHQPHVHPTNQTVLLKTKHPQLRALQQQHSHFYHCCLDTSDLHVPLGFRCNQYQLLITSLTGCLTSFMQKNKFEPFSKTKMIKSTLLDSYSERSVRSSLLCITLTLHFCFLFISN